MIIVNERYCKGCQICIQLCPKHVLELSKQVNNRGYYVSQAVDTSACTKCLQCQLLCPDFAIFVDEEETSAK